MSRFCEIGRGQRCKIKINDEEFFAIFMFWLIMMSYDKEYLYGSVAQEDTGQVRVFHHEHISFCEI